MSKERELLKRVITTHSDYGINTLYREINELLAQPKQSEQEPLSDEVVRKFADAEYMVCNNAFTMGVRWAEQQHKIGENCEQS